MVAMVSFRCCFPRISVVAVVHLVADLSVVSVACLVGDVISSVGLVADGAAFAVVGLFTEVTFFSYR